MLIHFLALALALVLLVAGAEGLVTGSASLALRAGISRLVVGLTIVAFGTSAPELVVSLKAALAGQGDIALGNVIGSNSFNIGIILGLTALVYPIQVNRQIITVHAPIAIVVALLVPLLLLDQMVGRGEGLLLLGGLVAYTGGSIVLGRREARAGDDDVPGARASRPWVLDLAFIAGGFVLLVLGSRLLVDHAVALAGAMGMSEAVIGLTIVAAGTSLPELATSLLAAFRKQPDIAIGNIVGSNIFNILAILGAAAATAPLQASGIAPRDQWVMVGFGVLLLPLLITGRRLHRVEGAALLVLYVGYLMVMWP